MQMGARKGGAPGHPHLAPGLSPGRETRSATHHPARDTAVPMSLPLGLCGQLYKIPRNSHLNTSFLFTCRGLLCSLSAQLTSLCEASHRALQVRRKKGGNGGEGGRSEALDHFQPHVRDKVKLGAQDGGSVSLVPGVHTHL